MNLGDRMKAYERITQSHMPGQNFVIIRIDGKAFHTYTKGLNRPFDDGLIEDMDDTARRLCEELQNVVLAYVQSDEISILMKESDITSQPWFKNNIQKISSISASVATEYFNKKRLQRAIRSLVPLTDFGYVDKPMVDFGQIMSLMRGIKPAHFDSRVWTVPNKFEVHNYFLWRQQDNVRNSISSAAQAEFSHNQLNGVSSADKKKMLEEIGKPWDNLSDTIKQGRILTKKYTLNGSIVDDSMREETGVRSTWIVQACPYLKDEQFIIQELEKRGDIAVL